MTAPEIPIIPTRLNSTMETVFDHVVAGAGLGICRGPAGTGKTFSVTRNAARLAETGVNVVRITASPAIGGALNAFIRAILAAEKIEAPSGHEGVELLFGLLKGYPFRPYGTRSVLIVDEAQELKTSILETIRGLWDRGDEARLGQADCPAFGCVLVGNDTFMGRNGTVNRAYFRPLLSRVTHNVSLPRPTAEEHAAYAAALMPEASKLQELLRGFGEDEGSFRAQAVAARQARLMAGQKNETVNAKHLATAIRMMGGK